MTRRPAAFTKADLTRAVSAALACNLPVKRTEISPDRIVLVHDEKGVPVLQGEFDQWKEKRNARSS